MLNRRELLSGASALCFGLCPEVTKAWTHGSGAPTNPLQSQRSLVNIRQIYTPNYAFIDHVVKTGIQPDNSAYWHTTAPWTANIDANGYPTGGAGTGAQWNASVKIPGDSAYTGTYILEVTGQCRVFLTNAFSYVPSANFTGTYSIVNPGVGVGKNSQIDTVTGQVMKYEFQVVAGQNTPVDITISISQASGKPDVTKIRWYRSGDATDLAAGNIFRSGFKSILVNHCPSAIRFMDWSGGASTSLVRFTNRLLPGKSSIQADWITSPVYSTQATATQTSNYAVVVAAASPTAANPKTTPTSMQHGEICTIMSPTLTPVRNALGVVSSITQANPGQVTCNGHGFNTGDKVIHMNIHGMTQINRVPCTITVIDANNYTVGFDTSGYSAFTFYFQGFVYAYVTLQVGSGSDRTSYPLFENAGASVPNFQLNPGAISGAPPGWFTVQFDKNLSVTDHLGVQTFGAWRYQSGTGFGYFSNDVPLEYCVALVNEVNAMNPVQPVHAYFNIPYCAINSFTPSYNAGADAGDRYAINALNIIINGNTTGGVTYAGLTSKASIFLEYSNEIWSGGTEDFYSNVRAVSRWGATANNFDDFCLWHTTNFVDAQSVYGTQSGRINYMLGLIGNGGYTTGSGNDTRCKGTAFYLADATVTGNSLGSPISYCEGAVIAPYIVDVSSSYSTNTTGTGCYTDDCARYGGWDNSGTLSFTGGNGGVSGSSITVTAIAAGTLIVGQPILWAGIGSSGFNYVYVGSKSGSLPTVTVGVVDQFGSPVNVTVANGTAMTGPQASGGNYVGAADQSGALQSYATAQNGAPQTGAGFWTSATTQLMAQVIPAGKYLCDYEGGTNWDCLDQNTPGGHLFKTAAQNSSAWATVQVNFFNNYSSISSHRTMPATYGIIPLVATDQVWSYCSPDSYGGTSTEGQGLLNNPAWAALSARNRAIF